MNAALTNPTRCLAKKILILALLGPSFAAGAAWAQEEKVASTLSVSFDFLPPGARSLAMGGAFLGLADDATAAYTNPAGLTNLTYGGAEIATELRSRRDTETVSSGGHLFGEASGIGLDTAEPSRRQVQGTTRGLSFLSVSYLLPRGVSLALYRHELLGFELETDSQGVFVGNCPDECVRFAATRSYREASVVNLGLSAAYELPVSLTRWHDALSFGLGLSLYELELLSRSDLYGGPSQFENCFLNPDGQLVCFIDRGPDGFFGPNLFLEDRYLQTQEEIGQDTDVRWSAGFLWKLGKAQRWRIGGAVRQGPRFATRFVTRARTAQLSSRPGTFTVPDSYGLGLAFSSHQGRTKVALDFNQIRYSQRRRELIEPLEGIFDSTQESSPELREFLDPRFALEDSNQLHLGFEHVFPIVEPGVIGTVRLGAWREPFHEPEYIGRNQDLRELFDSGQPRSQDHYAVGVGVVLRESFQIDLAADFSDLRDVISVSLVKFF